MRETFEKADFVVNSDHTISSENVLVEKETGRVVAVFYNDYDLDSVVEQLAQAPVVADLNLLIASKKLTDIYNKSPENAEDFIEAIENAFINFEAVVEAELNSGGDKVTLRAMLKESKS